MDQTIKITAEPKDAQNCKFTVDRPVYPGGSAYFGGRERATGSPLAEKLFAIDDVTGILISENLVTVTRRGEDDDWLPMAKKIGAAIREHLQSGLPAVSDKVLANMPSEREIKERVQHVLDSDINPAVAAHGGYVELLDVKKNTVYLRFGGGCQGCGMVNVTLKYGVERSIRDAIPEVGEILDTTDHASGRNPYYTPSK